MTAVVSPQLLKPLTDLTGEIHLDSALRIVTQDAIAYRLESIATQLHTLEQKYGISLLPTHVRVRATVSQDDPVSGHSEYKQPR
jgi:hypothetical protein